MITEIRYSNGDNLTSIIVKDLMSLKNTLELLSSLNIKYSVFNREV